MAIGTGSQLRTRRDVWKLPAGDDTLDWYGKAITELKSRPADDPTSWSYQAAVHDADEVPSNLTRFWAWCQHGCAYFLPWHRIYLFYFEKLIADTVASRLGGPADWSLPYWNYSDAGNPNAAVLPPAFRDRNSPLFVQQRDPRINDGRPLNRFAVDLSCLGEAVFFGEGQGSGGGFGGQSTGDPVHNGSWLGGLEGVPHGSVHTGVGGTGRNPGWMSSFTTAPLDPIFWLHHANIDRLWEVWRKRSPAHQIPNDNAWLGQRFEF